MNNQYPTALTAVKNIGNLTETEKKRYWNLFINRSDVYCKQTSTGAYSKISEQLTPEILFNEITVAGYQLNSENEIKWVCFDIDIDKKVYAAADFNIDDWISKLQGQATEISSELKKLNIPHYTEFSGKKGYHIWIFLEKPVKAAVAKKYFENLFSYRKLYPEINIEFFPKQESTNGGYGNFVKPPLQMHQVTGLYSYFVDEEFNPLDGLPEIEKFSLAQPNEPLNNSVEAAESINSPLFSNRTGPMINFSECKKEDLKFLPSAIKFLSDHIEKREDWIKGGFACASLGEPGRSYFHQLSNNPRYPEDTPESIDRQFDDLLRNKRERVSLSTIFFLAKQYGYKYPEPDDTLFEDLLEMFNQDDNRDPNKLLGFPLNKFKIIAEKLDGIQPGFYLLAADSNVGKTAVLNNLCLDALGTNPDLKVIYFSLDDSVRYTTYRFLSVLTGMGINNVKKPKLNPSLIFLLESKRNLFLEYIRTGRLLLKDIEKVSHIDHLLKEIERVKDKKNLMVFIDGLYNLEVSESNNIREENIERARKVKYLVDVYRIPVFTTGELRKKTQEQGKDKAPTIHDLMESGKYAYNANIVWMLYAKQEQMKLATPVLTLEYVKNKLSDFKGTQSLMFERNKGIISEVPGIISNSASTSAPGSGEVI